MNKAYIIIAAIIAGLTTASKAAQLVDKIDNSVVVIAIVLDELSMAPSKKESSSAHGTYNTKNEQTKFGYEIRELSRHSPSDFVALFALHLKNLCERAGWKPVSFGPIETVLADGTNPACNCFTFAKDANELCLTIAYFPSPDGVIRLGYTQTFRPIPER